MTRSLDRILGSYPPRDGYQQLEFQVGGVLIWVRRPLNMAESEAVRLAEHLLPQLWADTESALACALKSVGGATVQADRLVARQLRLMSILIWPDEGRAEFDIQPEAFDERELAPGEVTAAFLPVDAALDVMHTISRSSGGALCALFDGAK